MTNEKRMHGKCPDCGHYGSDCRCHENAPSAEELRRAKLRAALPAKRKRAKMPALFQWQKIKGGKGYRGVIDDARQLLLSPRGEAWQVLLDNSAANAADYLCDVPSLDQAKAIGQLVASGLRAREHVPALLGALMRLRDCPDVQMDCTEEETGAAREHANAVIASVRGWAL